MKILDKFGKILYENVPIEKVLESKVNLCFDGLILEDISFNNNNLSEATFRGATLRNVTFDDTDLRNVNFSTAKLIDTSFKNINTHSCKFITTHFINCVFNNFIFTNIEFKDSIFLGCSFKDGYIADSICIKNYFNDGEFNSITFNYCDLYYSRFYTSKFINTKISRSPTFYVNFEICTNPPYIPMACPTKGSFVGYKRVKNYLVKLFIPASAKRSSATSTKCRCSKAKVIYILDLETKESVKEIVNTNYGETKYKVGKMVYPDSFDMNRYNECSNGIHFFIDKQEALNYTLY